MIKGLNHIGIVVENIDQTVQTLESIFGAKELDRKSFPELGQTSCMVQLGNCLLELMEPIGTKGVVPKFLADHGQGLHHISLLSDNVQQEHLAITAKGVRMLGDPDSELRVVFTHPKDTNGIIYEITDIPFQAEGSST